MNPLIEIKNLSKTFVSNGKKLSVLSDISLTVNKGDFLAILGVSGSGKSTFLRCVGGFERPTSGSVYVNGNPVEKPGPYAAMVFQSFDQLFPWKTVYGNIAYPLEINAPKKTKKETDKIVNHYLNMVGLSGFRDYYPHQLSGGMKQRAAIARALAQKPSVILMDEPFASLDADTRTTLGREIVDIWHKARAEITILFVTHSIIEAISVATKFMVLKGDDYLIFPNPVKGKTGSVRSPEDEGFDECWKKLKNLIRN